jgi:hypothetical protein
MTKAIRKLPEQTPPVVTGGIQFGSEKSGVYFTGDVASYCAAIIKRAVSYCPEAAGMLAIELQSIADIFWASKINTSETTSISKEIANQAFEEAMGVVESVNAYLSGKEHSYDSPQAALKLQSKKIIQLLKQLQESK